jgi:hypothetical protein
MCFEVGLFHRNFSGRCVYLVLRSVVRYHRLSCFYPQVFFLRYRCPELIFQRRTLGSDDCWLPAQWTAHGEYVLCSF